MTGDRSIPSRWALPARAGRGQLLLRTSVVASVALAITCTRAAAGGSVTAIDVAIVGLAVACAVSPDTPLGVLLVGAIGVNWVTTVDDPTTPWAIGAAISLALLHTSLAAAGVAPIGASWSRAMARRWLRRFITVAAASIPVWGVIEVVDRVELDRSPALLTAALFGLALAGIWARHGTLDPPH